MRIIQRVAINNMFAYQLLAKLRSLTLWGQDEDGELEWCGTSSQWELSIEEESILRDWELKQF